MLQGQSVIVGGLNDERFITSALRKSLEGRKLVTVRKGGHLLRAMDLVIRDVKCALMSKANTNTVNESMRKRKLDQRLLETPFGDFPKDEKLPTPLKGDLKERTQITDTGRLPRKLRGRALHSSICSSPKEIEQQNAQKGHLPTSPGGGRESPLAQAFGEHKIALKHQESPGFLKQVHDCHDCARSTSQRSLQ